MAKGETLRKLFRCFSRDEREGFYAAAMELIEDERKKNHKLLARDLEKILHNGNGKPLASNPITNNNHLVPVPKDRETGFPLVQVQHHHLSWESVILDDSNLEVLQDAVLEHRKQDILRPYGLQPKSKLLFCGPPGCGKTLTAKVLAGVLDVPLLYVDLTAVFSSFLGETATNLKRIFDYVEQGEWVVLFDEFDALARERSAANEHGEVKRLVNSLLQLIDLSQSASLFIAATNHAFLLDDAVWRRFDDVLAFEKPSLSLRIALLKRYLTSVRHQLDLEQWAIELEGATGADIERICTDAIKLSLLKGNKDITAEELKKAHKRYAKRKSIIANSVYQQESRNRE